MQTMPKARIGLVLGQELFMPTECSSNVFILISKRILATATLHEANAVPNVHHLQGKLAAIQCRLLVSKRLPIPSHL